MNVSFTNKYIYPVIHLKYSICLNVFVPACLWVYRMHAVPKEVRKECLTPWNCSYRWFVGAQNQTWVFCKNSKCSWPLRHFSALSPLVLVLLCCFYFYLLVCLLWFRMTWDFGALQLMLALNFDSPDGDTQGLHIWASGQFFPFWHRNARTTDVSHHIWLLILLLFLFKTGSHRVALVGLELPM